MPRQIDFDLSERADPACNADLLAQLCANPGLPARISAAKRRRIDVPLLQILLSAQRHWAANGLDFCLADVSADQQAGLHLMGITADMLRLEARATALPPLAADRDAGPPQALALTADIDTGAAAMGAA